MSQLIRMRQRIKAIKTIKKITHALRLISMSTHLRLRSKKNALEAYKETLSFLFLNLAAMVPEWKHAMVKNSEKQQNQSLVILIGSQKGLCGNFNAELYGFFEEEFLKKAHSNFHIITVGRKAHDYVNFSRNIPLLFFDDFSITNVEKVSNALAQFILENAENYTSIAVYANISKSFFVQKPRGVQVIPFAVEPAVQGGNDFIADDYIWEQQSTVILDFLVKKLIHVTLYELLFQSLLAEQAARFIAMDNSTRSASKLLDSMQLLYNKMRQSKITGELTDLIGGFF